MRRGIWSFESWSDQAPFAPQVQSELCDFSDGPRQFHQARVSDQMFR